MSKSILRDKHIEILHKWSTARDCYQTNGALYWNCWKTLRTIFKIRAPIEKSFLIYATIVSFPNIFTMPEMLSWLLLFEKLYRTNETWLKSPIMYFHISENLYYKMIKFCISHYLCMRYINSLGIFYTRDM